MAAIERESSLSQVTADSRSQWNGLQMESSKTAIAANGSGHPALVPCGLGCDRLGRTTEIIRNGYGNGGSKAIRKGRSRDPTRDVPIFLPPLCTSHSPIPKRKMAMNTRKKNANTHPGHVVLGTQRKRRTRDEIEEDEACSQAKAIALKEGAAAKHRAVMGRISELEETAEQEDHMVQRFRIRPDQAQGITQGHLKIPVQSPTSDGGTADEIEEDEGEEEGDTQSDGSMRPDSTIANESSQSRLRSDGIDNEDPPMGMISNLDDRSERGWGYCQSVGSVCLRYMGFIWVLIY